MRYILLGVLSFAVLLTACEAGSSEVDPEVSNVYSPAPSHSKALLPGYLPIGTQTVPHVAFEETGSVVRVTYQPEVATSGQETGVVIRLFQTDGPFLLDSVPRDETVEIHGVKAALGRPTEPLVRGTVVTWNSGERGYQAEFLWVDNGQPTSYTHTQRSEILKVVGSMIEMQSGG